MFRIRSVLLSLALGKENLETRLYKMIIPRLLQKVVTVVGVSSKDQIVMGVPGLKAYRSRTLH